MTGEILGDELEDLIEVFYAAAARPDVLTEGDHRFLDDMRDCVVTFGRDMPWSPAQRAVIEWIETKLAA